VTTFGATNRFELFVRVVEQSAPLPLHDNGIRLKAFASTHNTLHFFTYWEACPKGKTPTRPSILQAQPVAQ
jgi:hypothetical protein